MIQELLGGSSVGLIGERSKLSTTPCGGAASQSPSPSPSPSSSAANAAAPPENLRCPRCDSPNTKFCYYNNYSLTQPRHFCKTCRRYWTKGGALRNVPIGGGCRKNKKIKPSPSHAAPLKFDNFPQFASNFADLSPQPPCFNLDPSQLGCAPSIKQGENLGFQEMARHSSLATSIESLSSINQDLHWKLQQQRLAALLAGDGGSQKEASGNIQKPQPSLENQKTDGSFSNTEWFLNNSYAPGNWSGGIQAWAELSHYTSLP